jgi:hypothetical protein
MLSEFGGKAVDIAFRKTRNERKTVILKDIFSPESTGITNVKMLRTARKMTGMMTFMKMYNGFLFKWRVKVISDSLILGASIIVTFVLTMDQILFSSYL